MSNLTVAKTALFPALATVARVVARSNTIPILSNLMIEAEGDAMSLTGSDLDCEMRASLPCKAAEKQSFTLPAALLHDAVRKLPDGAEIAIAADKDFATLISGRSRFKLPCLPSSDFPSISTGEFSHRFTLDAADLSRMLATVSFAISSEEARYYLNGIYWHEADAHMNAVATDGHRLARFRIETPEGAAGMPGIIVPRRTVGLLEKLIGDKGKVDISLSDTKLRFDTDQGSLVSKLIDGTFPDYQRVIPSGNTNTFSLDRGELSKAVDRVITISSQRGSAVKFAFGTDALGLTVVNPEQGSAADEVSIGASEGDAVDIGFNGRYCLDMLNACPGDRLVFTLGTTGDPALIEPDETVGIKPLFVLMPMRV